MSGMASNRQSFLARSRHARRARARHSGSPPRRTWAWLRIALTLAMSVLFLPFLGAPVDAKQGGDDPPPATACEQSGAKVDSFLQRASTEDAWKQGNVIEGLVEGGWVWEKVELSKLDPGPHQLVVDYTYQRDGKYAFDELGQYWFATGSETHVEPATAPSKPNEVWHRATFSWTQPRGEDTQTLVFAAHIGYGAADIPGSSYHLTIQSLDCVADGTRTNQVKVDKAAPPPEPDAASLAVSKVWVVNGTVTAPSALPAGLSATLTLAPAGDQATVPQWGEERTGYHAGDAVTVDETTQVPDGCRVVDRLLGEPQQPQTTSLRPDGEQQGPQLPQTVTLAAGSNSFTVTNVVACGEGKHASLTVRKTDESGALITEAPATFQLWDDVNADKVLDNGDTRVGDPVATSGGSHTWTGLAWGAYLVQETVAPTGYTLPSPAYQAVTLGRDDTAGPAVLTFTDTRIPPEPVTGSLTVRKHAGTTNGALIDTARFQLWNDTDANSVLDTAVDTKAGAEVSTSGGTYTWHALPYGKYVVQETAAPDGYTLPSPAYQAVTVHGAATLDFVDQPKVVPPPVTPTVHLQVRKHAAVTGALLDTATFQLWNDLNGNAVLDSADSRSGEAVSTSSGTYTWTGLTPGAYLVQETVAPAGYALPDPAYQPVRLTPAQAGTTVSVDFVDQALAGIGLQVRKHAGSVGGPLIGKAARFQLWNDTDGDGHLTRSVDTKAGTQVSTTGGTYTWTALQPGRYLVEETAAPAGYQLPSPRYRSVTLREGDRGGTVNVDVADAQIAGREAVRPPAGQLPTRVGPSYGGAGGLPQTGVADHAAPLGLLGASLTALGGCLLLVSRRRGELR